MQPLTKTTLQERLTKLSCIFFVCSDQFSPTNPLFNSPNTNSNSFIEVCCFAGLFQMMVFVTSLSTAEQPLHTHVQEIKFDKEVRQLQLRADSFILQFEDDSTRVYSFEVQVAEDGRIVQVDLKVKLEINKPNVCIFEKMCVFTSESVLVLNFFEINNEECTLKEIGQFSLSQLYEDEVVPGVQQDLSDPPKTLGDDSIFSIFQGVCFEGLGYFWF
jgi:hypothetical protein